MQYFLPDQKNYAISAAGHSMSLYGHPAYLFRAHFNAPFRDVGLNHEHFCKSFKFVNFRNNFKK